MKKTTTILLIIFISTIYVSKGQTPAWLWAQKAGSASLDEGKSVSADASGNIFVTGYYNGPSITFGAITLTNADPIGSSDIFIVKYSPSGTVLWAVSAGGNAYDAGLGVSADASGNVYVTGYFESPTLTFGTFTLTNADNSGNTGDVFLVKYSPAEQHFGQNPGQADTTIMVTVCLQMQVEMYLWQVIIRAVN